MSKVKVHSLVMNKRKKIIGDFLQLVLDLRSKEQVADVMVGLMTPSEALMFARRVQIARALLREETYETIRKKLRVGFDTITKVEQWLHTDNEKRDHWLARQVKKLDALRALKPPKMLGKGKLDRYPEHRMVKVLLNSLFK